MKIRGGFAAIVSLLCLMILVIVGGRSGQSNTAELAASEDLTVATDDGHDHAEGDDHGEHAAEGDDHGEHAAAGTDHGEHATGEDHTEHPVGVDHTDHPVDPADPAHEEHPVDPPSAYTQEQLDLLHATQAWISPRFDNVQDAISAGYTSIGDAGTGWEHYVNNQYLNSPQILTPATIESLVYKVSGSSRTLVSGMYILPIGQTLANTPPAFTTPQTPWHVHTNLCWKLNPIRVVGITETGQAGCPPDSIYFVTPPMLHVWIQPQTCGWFSDLEQVETGDCEAHPH
jgi:hypothetical protein